MKEHAPTAFCVEMPVILLVHDFDHSMNKAIESQPQNRPWKRIWMCCQLRMMAAYADPSVGLHSTNRMQSIFIA